MKHVEDQDGHSECGDDGEVRLMIKTSSGRPWPMPAKAENMSGAPLPRAIIVTPAMFWDNLTNNGIQHQHFRTSSLKFPVPI